MLPATAVTPALLGLLLWTRSEREAELSCRGGGKRATPRLHSGLSLLYTLMQLETDQVASPFVCGLASRAWSIIGQFGPSRQHIPCPPSGTCAEVVLLCFCLGSILCRGHALQRGGGEGGGAAPGPASLSGQQQRGAKGVGRTDCWQVRRTASLVPTFMPGSLSVWGRLNSSVGLRPP